MQIVTRCLYGEELDLSVLGRLRITCGSHVEPTEDGCWAADLSQCDKETKREMQEGNTAERRLVDTCNNPSLLAEWQGVINELGEATGRRSDLQREIRDLQEWAAADKQEVRFAKTELRVDNSRSCAFSSAVHGTPAIVARNASRQKWDSPPLFGNRLPGSA